MRLLLTHGADPAMVNKDGHTALELARMHGNEVAEVILASAESSVEGDEESL